MSSLNLGCRIFGAINQKYVEISENLFSFGMSRSYRTIDKKGIEK